VSDRAARALLVVLGAGLALAVLRLDLPKAAGQFWSDGATYHGMAWSLAEDLDLRFEARDVFRVRREFPQGPQGIFLKRTSGGLRVDRAAGFPWLRWSGGEPSERIFFAKALAYPLAAAPLVRLFGTNGLLLLNVLAWLAALLLAYGELRSRMGPLSSLLVALSLFALTATPLYLLWLQPEMFNLGLIAAGLCLQRRRPLAAAVLLGVATYSKPYNLLLALPLGAAPLLPWLRGGGGPALGPALRESVRRGGVLASTTAALFALNWLVTGEINYQGGERKTFYGQLPFEARDDGTPVTFGNSGFWMTTDHLGPLVEGRDEAKESRRTGPLRPAEEMRASFLRNLGYFWVGRFAGVLAYFLPALAAILVFVLAGPRTEDGGLALAALLCSWLFYIWQIPDNWYGGGGTVGNRYFLNLLPLVVFLVPRGAGAGLVVAAGALGAALFLRGILLEPLHHSLHPGDHAKAGAFRALPPELTMLNDLSVFTEAWRKKQAYGFMGDPVKHWPADPAAYTLYFMDDGTWGRESHEGRDGFWIRTGAEAEVILRALDIKPVRGIVLEARGGPGGDRLSCRLGGAEKEVLLRAGQPGEVTFAPPRGFPYYETFLYVLRCRSRGSGEAAAGRRAVGSFVSLRLEVG
jgi:hypothetical protein